MKDYITADERINGPKKPNIWQRFIKFMTTTMDKYHE